MENWLKWMHRYVSPVFLALLSRRHPVVYRQTELYVYRRTDREGERRRTPFELRAWSEGVGTNLFGYRVYMNKTLRIPLAELKTKRSYEEGHEGKLIIDPQSLQNALAPRFSDIKIISIGDIPEIDVPRNP